MKKKAYWDKINELIMIKREVARDKKKVADEHYGDNTVDEKMTDEHYGNNTVDEQAFEVLYAEEYEEDDNTGLPRVQLQYPKDYEAVKNLPSRRMKRAARKRVRSWARKTLTCLATTLVALASPVFCEAYEAVVEPAQDLVYAVTGRRDQRLDDRADLLELFAGSAHLSMEFVEKGYSVLEPRDILYGHDLFDPLQQKEVMRAIETSQPKLLWIALPCTKWSPWQRYNYAHRKQELRRQRKKQRKLIAFAVECAWQQVANSREVVFEHPKESDMWSDESVRGLLETDLFSYAELDMCRYNLRATTDGGPLRKPTRLATSNHALIVELTKKCHGGHQHSPTEGRNTKAAGIYTKEFCRAILRGYQQYCGNIWNYEGEECERNTWKAYALKDVGPTTSSSSSPSSPPTAGDLATSSTPRRPSSTTTTTGIHLPDHVPKHLAQALREFIKILDILVTLIWPDT